MKAMMVLKIEAQLRLQIRQPNRQPRYQFRILREVKILHIMRRVQIQNRRLRLLALAGDLVWLQHMKAATPAKNRTSQNHRYLLSVRRLSRVVKVMMVTFDHLHLLRPRVVEVNSVLPPQRRTPPRQLWFALHYLQDPMARAKLMTEHRNENGIDFAL